MIISSENPDIDSRDVQRIKYNLPYISRFITHKSGDKEAAYEMMVNNVRMMSSLNNMLQVDALKWRKSFGVQGNLCMM